MAQSITRQVGCSPVGKNCTSIHHARNDPLCVIQSCWICGTSVAPESTFCVAALLAIKSMPISVEVNYTYFAWSNESATTKRPAHAHPQGDCCHLSSGTPLCLLVLFGRQSSNFGAAALCVQSPTHLEASSLSFLLQHSVCRGPRTSRLLFFPFSVLFFPRTGRPSMPTLPSINEWLGHRIGAANLSRLFRSAHMHDVLAGERGQMVCITSKRLASMFGCVGSCTWSSSIGTYSVLTSSVVRSVSCWRLNSHNAADGECK